MADITQKQLANGIDSHSAKSAIKEGYSEDIVNMDTSSGGYLTTRPGYEGTYGWIPLRVTQLEHSGTSIRFQFDSSQNIDLGSVSSSPIVAYGKTSDSSATGDFTTTDAAEYYSTWSLINRDTITVGSNTISKTSTDHGLSHDKMFIGFTAADESTGSDNTQLTADNIEIDSTTYQVDVDYTATVAGDAFIYISDKSAVAGTTYLHSATASTSETITAATHQLNNFNIQIKCWDSAIAAGSLTEVIPSNITIDGSGEVVVEFASNFTGTIILNAAPNSSSGNAVVGGNTFTISSPGSAFNFVSVYYWDSSSNKFTSVMTDNITYDVANDQLEVTYTLAAGAELVDIYWENASVASNVIEVTDNSSTSETYTDTAPQLTVWGISHDGIYKDTTSRGGHVNHIDGYKRALESRIVAGLGGNLFAGRTREEVGTSYLMPSQFLLMNERIDGDVDLAPLFQPASGGDTRTRGSVDDASNVANKALITAVTYVSSTEVDYTLSFTSSQTITGKIDTNDKFTVEGMPYNELNGTFNFVSVSDDGTTAPVLRLSNSNGNSRFDSTGLAGRVGCFTEKLTMEATPIFLANDSIFYTSTAMKSGLTVLAVDSTSLYISGVDEQVCFADGVKLQITRSTNTLYVGDTNDAATVTNFVEGDILEVGGVSHKLRITDIDTTNKTLTIDDNVSVSDGATVAVDGRWIPIEAPGDSYDLTADTYVKHFDTNDYDQQVSIRSTMMNDNMYFVNGDDEVLKFDGTNIYRAGLFRWQPQMFSTIRTGSTTVTGTGIVPNTISVAYTAHSGNRFTVASGEASSFAVGDRIEDDIDNNRYTVQSVDTVNDFVYVTEKITSTFAGTPNLSRVIEYRYYFRLNAIDANNNVIASAVTASAGDARIELAEASDVVWRLVGMPAWDIYDYDRLELQVYRTRGSTVAPYYLVRTVLMDFDNNEGYINVVDSTPDFTLTTLDAVNTSLLGAELGTTWSEPLRAEWITSANNRLLLGNVRSYPKFDITIDKTAEEAALADTELDGTYFEFTKDTSDNDSTWNNVARYTFYDSATTVYTITGTADDGGNLQIQMSSSPSISVGQWVYLYWNAEANGNELDLCGWWQVSATSGNNFTINLAYDASLNEPNRALFGSTTNVPVWLGTDGNYAQRDGNVSTTIESMAAFRLSQAINASMRMTDIEVSGQGDFTPWLTAGSGNDFGRGQIMITQPKSGVASSQVELNLADATSTQIFIQGIKRADEATVDSDVFIFPSRLIQSYPRFPEIFDMPDAFNDIDGDSARDINSADGQKLDAGIPFFGESTFGSGRLNDVVALFKSNSIYVYNTETREYQKLDSRGLGCTAPKSVAATRNGIMFANESGIYRLNRDLSIVYVGEFLEQKWKDLVNLSQISEMAGHQHRRDQKYKLSFPTSTNNYNSLVFTYDHENEGKGQLYGSWTRYTNHNTTLWANLDEDSYFGSQTGNVFRIRTLGNSTDYRDDASAISIEWTTRAEDFGAPNRRKLIHRAHIDLILETNVTGLSASSRTNLSGSFASAGTITETVADNEYIPVRLSIPDRRGTSIQLKITHSVKDEKIYIAGLSWKVDGLDEAGTPEAADYN